MQKLIYDVGKKLYSLLKGKIPQKIELSDYPDEGEREFSEIINELIESFSETLQFALALSEGNLNKSLPKARNILSSPFKQLHAQLKHLTWQTERIAAGDYNQRVDFMGDFSKAFNSMVVKLADREKALKQARDELETKVKQRTAELAEANDLLKQDITKRKQVEEKLERQRKNLQAIFEAAPVGMFLMNENKVIGKINNAVKKLTSKTKSEIINSQLGNVFNCINSSKNPKGCGYSQICLSCSIRNAIQQVLDSSNPIHEVEVCPTILVNGREIKPWLEISIETVEIDYNRHLVVAVQDITNRKQTQERLEVTIKELSQLNEQLQDFLHIAAHDLRTPIRGIGTLAYWILEDYSDKFDEEGREKIRLLVKRVERMYKFIDSLQQYSSIKRNKQEDQEVDLNALVTEVINGIGPTENVKITLSNTLPIIVCQKQHMKQVFENLLSNAFKYMDKSQGQVTVGSIETDNTWKLVVADNGPGIEERHFGKIFQVFQILSTRDEVESAGVGLSVAKKIVEIYGGKIWVESKPGEGSTFFFTLPKQESEVVDDAKLEANIACG